MCLYLLIQISLDSESILSLHCLIFHLRFFIAAKEGLYCLDDLRLFEHLCINADSSFKDLSFHSKNIQLLPFFSILFLKAILSTLLLCFLSLLAVFLQVFQECLSFMSTDLSTLTDFLFQLIEHFIWELYTFFRYHVFNGPKHLLFFCSRPLSHEFSWISDDFLPKY